ncbi:hypothetical protein MRB53_013848 [Persea americana]|uniref:Uncharacterized protein n=1 Tax=Persea americana TaxID=3435 RepID=A0ACC2K9J7_PERAE|nr:hypothetical protein MRB53_013848 [Persea americana]
MSSATSVSGFGNQTATKTCKSSHLQVTTRFFIPLETIQDVDISISIIPVFKQVNDVGYNDPSVIDKRVSRKTISLNTTANGIVEMIVEGLNKYLGGETFMLINLHHLPSVHYIIEQSSILIPFLSIVLKQIVVQEAEEPKKMVTDLKNTTSLVLELCGTFFTRKLRVQSLSVTFFIFLFSITNALYSLAILENSWSGFTLH